MTRRDNTFHVGDNLPIMKGMDDSFVDLIYADPPFNSGRNYSGKEGSIAEGATFNDVWTWGHNESEGLATLRAEHQCLCNFIDNTRSYPMSSYLLFMSLRIIEMRRILKDTGSIYLHCDTSASHYLKVLADFIFGADNFKNEIVMSYTGPQRANSHYPRKHDAILFYTKSNRSTFNADAIRVPSKWNEMGGYSKKEIRRTNKGKVPEDWWHITFGPNTKERTGYPTQKPLALLERIIDASSNIGDTILDPFCGSGTTLISAGRMGRTWIGIDTQRIAKDVFESRLCREHHQRSFIGE